MSGAWLGLPDCHWDHFQDLKRPSKQAPAIPDFCLCGPPSAPQDLGALDASRFFRAPPSPPPTLHLPPPPKPPPGPERLSAPGPQAAPSVVSFNAALSACGRSQWRMALHLLAAMPAESASRQQQKGRPRVFCLWKTAGVEGLCNLEPEWRRSDGWNSMKHGGACWKARQLGDRS